jgi:hypothetical protein
MFDNNTSLEAIQWLRPPIPRRMLQAMNVNFPMSYALGKISGFNIVHTMQKRLFARQ